MKALTSTLLLIVAALLAALGWNLLAKAPPLAWEPDTAVAHAASPEPDTLALPQLSVEQMAVAWQQPLFSPDRQPDLPRTMAVGTSLGDLALGGVMIQGDTQWALLREHGNRALKLKPGDRLDSGWTVQKLTATSITFQRQGQTQTLNLPVPRLPTPAAALALPPSHVATP